MNVKEAKKPFCTFHDLNIACKYQDEQTAPLFTPFIKNENEQNGDTTLPKEEAMFPQ